MLGTVRKNKPELPSELPAMKNRKVTSSMFAFTDRATIVSYYLNKGKKYPADEHHAQRCCSEHQRRQKTTNGLGLQQDKGRGWLTTATYSHMTARWPLVILFNIIDLSTYNAFVIWSEINKDWNSEK